MRPLLLLILLAGGGRADEGMWPFNQPPREQIKKAYGFQLTDAFLEHLRLASVRFNNGGSGSFVSPQGLLFTNHHVGADCIQKVSSKEHDYMAEGFYAATPAEEKPCPDLELNVLLRIEDVTAQVNAGIEAGAGAAEAGRRRRANMSTIEKECATRTGNRCDVVTLFSGGQYHLYQYKKYTEVRLVFAPEHEVAAFGGDPDNFTFPRYCLDIAFFRAYEAGQPARPERYLRWSRQGVREGELTFVSGSPGTTGRLLTMVQLEFARDESYPMIQRRLESLVETLRRFSARGGENKRVAREPLQYAENSLKAYRGFLVGLRDPDLMRRKQEEERKLRAAVDRDPALQREFGTVWDEVASAYREYRKFYQRYWLLESSGIQASALFPIARHVLRLPEEKARPNEQRLREYRESNLPSIEQAAYSPAPISPALEIAVIADYLRFLQREFGAAAPPVEALLDGRSPEAAAGFYGTTSKLGDVPARRKPDPADGMLLLARRMDGPAREVRKLYEDQVESVILSSAGRIAQARYRIWGAGDYPDATFTLRLAYGPVKGYGDARGRSVPYATVMDGLFRRATGREPFALPKRWLDARPRLNRTVPYNFVTTADTHGGNSGSPTVNTKGELVGIVFDGNLESLPDRFVYTDWRARTIHVAAPGIVEALRQVYRAERVLQELGFTPSRPPNTPLL
jgi:hypothetical protein